MVCKNVLLCVPDVASFRRFACFILVTVFTLASTLARAENTSASGGSDRLLNLLSHKRSESALDAGAGIRAFFTAFADTRGGASSVELCLLKAPMRAVKTAILDIRQAGLASEIYAAATPKNAIASINGGFFGFDKEGRLIPLGFVKENGIVRNRRHPWTSGGVLALGAGEPRIMPIAQFHDEPGLTHALQSKPLLIEQGRDGIRGRGGKRANRSAVAVTEDGALLFAVVHDAGDQAATLAEFSRLLLAYRTPSNGKVTWALAMDGGPSAHLYVPPQLKRHCGVEMPTYVPNTVIIAR